MFNKKGYDGMYFFIGLLIGAGGVAGALFYFGLIKLG